MATEDLVNVLVPRKHLSQVYGLIAQLEGAAPSATATIEEPPMGNGATDEWTPSRLRTMVEDSGPAMRDLLRAMAARPGEWLTTQDLAAALKNKPKADWNTIAGTLGAFGRRVKSRYGLETWPFQVKRDHEHHCWIYSMSQEVAKKILALLNDTK
ncbi:MAG: hypothetical protein IT439_02845 [Phycisphaerales bacterium]|nr:hypothetical protein [Phycisphaerales bacterium]